MTKATQKQIQQLQNKIAKDLAELQTKTEERLKELRKEQLKQRKIIRIIHKISYFVPLLFIILIYLIIKNKTHYSIGIYYSSIIVNSVLCGYWVYNIFYYRKKVKEIKFQENQEILQELEK